MDVPIKAGAGPLAEQVAEHFRRRIASGQCPHGSKLPPSDRVPGVSHVTVLKAYRSLAREGLVAISRATGTEVIARQEAPCYVLITQHASRIPTITDAHLSGEFLEQAHGRNGRAEIFHLPTGRIDTVAEAERMVPDNLRQMLLDRRVKGLLVNHPSCMIGLVEWLQRWSLPVVSINGPSEVNRVKLDRRQMYLLGVQQLQAAGCGRILVLVPPHDEDGAALVEESPGDGVTWRLMGASFAPQRAVSSGRRIIRELAGGELPEGLLIPDDLVGLGVLLGRQGMGKDAAEMKLAIATGTGQLADAFASVIQLRYETADLLSSALDIVDRCFGMANHEPVVTQIAFTCIPPEEGTP